MTARHFSRHYRRRNRNRNRGPRRRRRDNLWIWAVALAVILLIIYLAAGNQLSLSPAPTPNPTTTATTSPGDTELSDCDLDLLDEITLIYRDGSPDEDRMVATFFPWGCPTQEVSCTFSGPHEAYPDPECTPGAIYDLTGNTDPTQYSEAANQDLICATIANARNGSKDRRDVSEKDDAWTWERYDRTKPVGEPFATDHFIPISMGGSNDVANLVPQVESGPRDGDEKYTVERKLGSILCDTQADGSYVIGLSDAQNRLRHQWTELYDQIQRDGQITV